MLSALFGSWLRAREYRLMWELHSVAVMLGKKARERVA
jgi:hypothetical protein